IRLASLSTAPPKIEQILTLARKCSIETPWKFRFLAHSRASPCRSAAASGVISLKDPDGILFRSNS
ncbi:hypothetical protein OFC51_33915, partial [Escherichia coli]|nr:hypothetical protein [Escherichia coli]